MIDKTIYVHGAGGMTADLPLAMLGVWAWGPRFGPEEVHQSVLARRELRRYRAG